MRDASHRVLGQAGQPKGLLGRMFGRVMAWHNAPDNAWTIDLLNLQGSEQVLEIGFGPGIAIEQINMHYPMVQVHGVDHADTMLAAGQSRNRNAIAAGKVKLQLGSVMHLAFADASFDKAFAVNCIYFWESPLEGLRELHRVLKPGGCLAITVRDSQRQVYQPFRPDKLRQLFTQAGFEHVAVSHYGVPSHPLICVLGEKR